MAAVALEKYMPTAVKSYWQITRAPFFGLLLVLFLLLIYESSAATLASQGLMPSRNTAELLIKRGFTYYGLNAAIMIWIAYAILLWGAYYFTKKQKLLAIQAYYFPLAIFESLLYALFFGTIVNLMQHNFTIKFILFNGNLGASLPTNLALALSAGIYEEIIFRLLIAGTLLYLFKWTMSPKLTIRGTLAILISSAAFAGYHYLGNEQFTMTSFNFRFYSGIVLGGLFLFRGIGVAAYTHAFYDLYLLLRTH